LDFSPTSLRRIGAVSFISGMAIDLDLVLYPCA
jgi:hypothetical protein